MIWNRSRWIRGAADSQRRRQVQNPKSAWIVRDDSALRIVPDAIWNVVKARQARQAAEVGARIRRGLSKHDARRTGRQPRYLFSGLLICGQCGSRFTIRNPRSYACSSWVNGKACSNRVQVRRDLVERVLLAQVKDDLSNPEIVAHVGKEVRRRLKAGRRKVAQSRVQELEREIYNLAGAVATGALAARLPSGNLPRPQPPSHA